MKHFVFDLDGTLIDSHPPYLDIIAKVFERYKDESVVIDYSGIRKIFAHRFLSMHIPESRMSEAFDYFLKLSRETLHEVQLFDGIHETLEHLKAQDIPIAIWTGRERETADEVIRNTGLHLLVDQIVTGSCVQNNKPDPEGLLKILSEKKWRPEDAVMIGDSDFDVHGARAANVRAVSVGWGNPEAGALVDLSDHHFHLVTEFTDWVKAKV